MSPGNPSSGAAGSEKKLAVLIPVKGSSIVAVPVEITRTSPPRPGPMTVLEIWAPLRSVSCGAVTTTSPPRPVTAVDVIDAPVSRVREPADTETCAPSPASAALWSVLALRDEHGSRRGGRDVPVPGGALERGSGSGRRCRP